MGESGKTASLAPKKMVWRLSEELDINLYPSSYSTMKRIFAWISVGMNNGNALSAWVVL